MTPDVSWASQPSRNLSRQRRSHLIIAFKCVEYRCRLYGLDASVSRSRFVRISLIFRSNYRNAQMQAVSPCLTAMICDHSFWQSRQRDHMPMSPPSVYISLSRRPAVVNSGPCKDLPVRCSIVQDTHAACTIDPCSLGSKQQIAQSRSASRNAAICI